MMNNTSTTMAILLLATAVMLIGGLAVIPAFEEAEAKGCPTLPSKGDPVPPGFANSEGKCFNIPNTPR